MTTENLSGFNAHDKIEGREEWLSPPLLIQALGEFDLDPCSPINRPWPTAKNHFTILDNGLTKPWEGRVWLNPPYGAEAAKWLARAAEHRNVTALIFARTETRQFFDYIWPKATAVCFLKGRLSFYHVNGKQGGTAGAPSMLVTWDDDNANILWQSVMDGTTKGAYIDLRTN